MGMLLCFSSFAQISKGYVQHNIEVFQGKKSCLLLAGSEVRIKQYFQDGVDLILLSGSKYVKQNSDFETKVSYPLNVFCTYNSLDEIDFRVRAKNLQDFWIQQLENSDAF